MQAFNETLKSVGKQLADTLYDPSHICTFERFVVQMLLYFSLVSKQYNERSAPKVANQKSAYSMGFCFTDQCLTPFATVLAVCILLIVVIIYICACSLLVMIVLRCHYQQMSNVRPLFTRTTIRSASGTVISSV